MNNLNTCGFVIPCFNENESLAQLQENITWLRENQIKAIVVDGGSYDGSVDKLQPFLTTLGAQFISSDKGRAKQMNKGAENLATDYLFFLHADTVLPKDFIEQLQLIIEQQAQWGFFQLGLSGEDVRVNLIARVASLRSQLTSVATGDQLIFVKRDLFESIGGYQDIPLMEDVALSKNLRNKAKPKIVKSKVISSSRRWKNRGVFSTVLLMWKLRLMYLLGVSPEKLHKQYYG